MIFTTSDHHLGHANIIRFCNRPFADATEMGEELIRRWNEVVGPDDTVYHLGDFTLAGRDVARGYFARLNGGIKVLGNHWHHDRRWLPRHFGPTDFLSATGQRVEILPPIVVLKLPEYGNDEYDQVLVLCHYPLAEWDRQHFGSWHAHGHVHDKTRNFGGGSCLNVGVDFCDFRPLSLDELAKRFMAM